MCSVITAINSNLVSAFDNRCMFCSVNVATNIWESVWIDQGQIFAGARPIDTNLSKMSIRYAPSGSNVILQIKALSTGIYRFGYASIGVTSNSNQMQIKEQQYNAGDYIFNDSYDYNNGNGYRACYCEFVR